VFFFVISTVISDVAKFVSLSEEVIYATLDSFGEIALRTAIEHVSKFEFKDYEIIGRLLRESAVRCSLVQRLEALLVERAVFLGGSLESERTAEFLRCVGKPAIQALIRLSGETTGTNSL